MAARVAIHAVAPFAYDLGRQDRRRFHAKRGSTRRRSFHRVLLPSRGLLADRRGDTQSNSSLLAFSNASTSTYWNDKSTSWSPSQSSLSEYHAEKPSRNALTTAGRPSSVLSNMSSTTSTAEAGLFTQDIFGIFCVSSGSPMTSTRQWTSFHTALNRKTAASSLRC